MADQTNNGQTNVPDFGDILLQIQFSDPATRNDKETGRQLASRIYREQQQNTTFYFGGRSAQWNENTMWSLGRQNMNEFKDVASIDGNKGYYNADFTPVRTGVQFTETLVDSICSNDEYPCVSAIDEQSLVEKDQRQKDAVFRMHDKDFINDVTQKSGVQLEPPNAYVPDDEIAAEVYFKLQDRLPKEIDFEEKLENDLSNNDYKRVLKRRLVRDLIVVNCAATKIEKLDKFIYIKKVIPQNLVYNFFQSDNGKLELAYIGEIYSLKVRELRIKYGKSESNPSGLSEQELFNIAGTATQYNVANRYNFYWQDSFIYDPTRPYDDFSISCFDFEINIADSDYYVSKTDAFGKENITLKKGVPKPTSDRAAIIKKEKSTWYRGVWAMKADKMLYWGLPDLQIRPYMDISQSLSSYSIIIPNNNGDYIPSLFERALEPLREYTVCKLKRKQLIGNLVPSGYSIDIETLRDIDLGNGRTIPAEEGIKIYNQTGKLIWSSIGLNPNQPNKEPPIKGLANAESFAQLNELTMVMNSCMQEIRSLLGVPLYRDGSDLPERASGKQAQFQNVAANNVTDFINNAEIQLMEETLHKCCILHWNEAVMNGEDDLIDTIFRVKVEMKPTLYEQEQLEAMITAGLQEQLLDFKDAFYIRQIKNYKLAFLYLSSTADKKRKQAMEESQANIAANGQIQQQSIKAKAEVDLQLKQSEATIEMQLQTAKFKGEKELALLNGVLMVAAKDETGQLIKMFLPAIQQLVPNIEIPLELQNKVMTMQIEDAMQNAANPNPQPQDDSDQQQQQPMPPQGQMQPLQTQQYASQ